MTVGAQIGQALAELEMVSHAPIQGYNFAPPEVGRGERWRSSDRKAPIPHLGQHSAKGGDTKTPQGTDRERPHDAEEAAALRESYHGKTVGYYRRRLGRDGASEALLEDIRQTVKSWRVMQIPEGQPPAKGDPQWKKWVAESSESNAELARKFVISREYIRQVRKEYREGSSD